MRAYAPADEAEPVHRGTTAREFVLMVIVAFAIASAVALLWPVAGTTELTTGSTTVSGAAARGDKATCADQTWPYLDNACLSRKR